MVQYHVLIVFLATVTFAICEARGGRRNYNTNANVNTNVLGGWNRIPGMREDLHDKNPYWPQESFLDDPNFSEIRDPEGLYGDSGYPHHEQEEEDAGYDRTIPDFHLPRRDGKLGGKICDDGHNHRTYVDGLGNPINDEWTSRRFSGCQAYRRVWNGPPPIVIEPSYPNNNWGHLNPPIFPMRRAYVRPAIGPIPMQNRQTPYVVDRPAPQSLDLRPHQPATSPQANLGSNINSNANSNVIGRRHNANSNSNTNIIGHGRYGRPRHSPDAGHESLPYQNYAPPNHPVVSRGVPTIRVPAPKPRPDRPGYLRPWPRPKPDHDSSEVYPFESSVGDEYDNDSGYMEFAAGGRYGNSNVNSNSNVNILNRRMQPRNRRSAEHLSKKLFDTAKLDEATTTKVAIEGSTTSGRP